MEYDHRYIKHIRLARNLTQEKFSHFINIDPSTIGKLERGELDFTPYYHEKLKDVIKRLRISNMELVSIGKLIEIREQRGYKQ